MLSHNARLTVWFPIHPQGVEWVQASQSLPHQTRETISLWILLCARGYCHVESDLPLTATVGSTLLFEISLYALKFPGGTEILCLSQCGHCTSSCLYF